MSLEPFESVKFKLFITKMCKTTQLSFSDFDPTEEKEIVELCESVESDYLCNMAYEQAIASGVFDEADKCAELSHRDWFNDGYNEQLYNICFDYEKIEIETLSETKRAATHIGIKSKRNVTRRKPKTETTRKFSKKKSTLRKQSRIKGL